MSATRVRTAVLPVAGLGTRFLPVTKAVPKEMLPLLTRPVIAWIAAEAVEAGCERIILVTSRGKGALDDYFDHSPELERALDEAGKSDLLAAVREAATMAEVVSVRQRRILGLGHAVLTARSVVPADEPFAVCLGDDVIDAEVPALTQLMRTHEETGDAVVAVVPVPRDQTRRYGICAGPHRDEWRVQVEQMVEKPAPEVAPSNYGIVGRYVLVPEIWEALARTGRGSGGEIQLTDAIAELAAQGRVTAQILQGKRFDTGNVLGLLRATLYFAHKDPAMRDEVRAMADEILGDRG